MSAPLEKLRRLAGRDVKDHTAIFDLYVTVGRDIDYLSIKFGMDPDDVICLLEGYGEKIRLTSEACGPETDAPGSRAYDGDDPDVKKSLEEFGIALDYAGKGRLKNMPRVLVEEYVERFYPGIASEHPENDWINIESYMDQMHPGWRVTLEQARPRAGQGDAAEKGSGKKVRNKFRLFG